MIVGIDLGTSTSEIAVLKNGVPTLVREIAGSSHGFLPSVVAIGTDGQLRVGEAATALLAVRPEASVAEVKRLMGTDQRISLGGESFTPQEISALILRHLKREAEAALGEPVDRAVITVPAYFTALQRRATHDAGELAGLTVQRLINEPTAAALAYGFGQDREQMIVVFDFGGGTFDVSVLQIRGEVFEVLASEGDFFLGGDDLDRALAENLAAELHRVLRVDPRPHGALMMKLLMGAEAIKMHLSDNDAAEGEIEGLDLPGGKVGTLPFALTRAQFEELIAGYVQRTMAVTRQVLIAANIDPRMISDVLCVGGSTRIPAVRNRLADVFKKQPNIGINPDEVVAQGAAIQAGSLTGALAAGTGMGARDAVATVGHSPLLHGGARAQGPLARPVLLDVNPSTLSIQTAGGYAEHLLDKNSPIPIERTRVFTTARDNQTRVEIDCCRG
ncbi:MAG TPA: Hsp70 family protein, partial [Gaiellales bacterium]|nr:Hsp70 family protein [Gaiellales bacterium]